MIRAGCEKWAAAIAERVPADVAVVDHPPDTVAGPAVWIDLDTVRWATGLWQVGLAATIIAGDGAAATPTAVTLDDLTDAVLAAGYAIGDPATIAAAATTVPVGSVNQPGRTVSITLPFDPCELA